MCDFPGANGSLPLCVVAFFLPTAARAGVLEPLQKWEWSSFEPTSSLTQGFRPFFSMFLIRLRLPEGEECHYA